MYSIAGKLSPQLLVHWKLLPRMPKFTRTGPGKVLLLVSSLVGTGSCNVKVHEVRFIWSNERVGHVHGLTGNIGGIIELEAQETVLKLEAITRDPLTPQVPSTKVTIVTFWFSHLLTSNISPKHHSRNSLTWDAATSFLRNGGKRSLLRDFPVVSKMPEPHSEYCLNANDQLDTPAGMGLSYSATHRSTPLTPQTTSTHRRDQHSAGIKHLFEKVLQGFQNICQAAILYLRWNFRCMPLKIATWRLMLPNFFLIELLEETILSILFCMCRPRLVRLSNSRALLGIKSVRRMGGMQHARQTCGDQQ